MVIVATTVKYLREIFRSRAKTAILLLSPIIFFSFFGYVFSADSGSITYTIGVISDDNGFDNLSIVNNPFSEVPIEISLADQYLDLFHNHTSSLVDTDIVISVAIYEELDQLTTDLEGQQLQLGVVFPHDFTSSILDGLNQLANQTVFQVTTDGRASIELYGDPTIGSYQTVYSIFQQSMGAYVSTYIGLDSLYDQPPSGGYLQYEHSSIQTEEFSEFDFFFPGFLVFLIILQAITISGALVYERESGTITRLKMSKIYSWELFTGITLGQLIAFTLQFFVSVLVLFLWDVSLDIQGWFYVYIISQITNLTIIGLCLIVAAFVDSVDNAGSITGIGSAPLGFLSGSFLQVPEVYIIPSLNIQFWDLIPTYHANIAIREVMFFGADLTDIFGRLGILVISALILYVLGIIAFNRRVVKGDT